MYTLRVQNILQIIAGISLVFAHPTLAKAQEYRLKGIFDIEKPFETQVDEVDCSEVDRHHEVLQGKFEVPQYVATLMNDCDVDMEDFYENRSEQKATVSECKEQIKQKLLQTDGDEDPDRLLSDNEAKERAEFLDKMNKILRTNYKSFKEFKNSITQEYAKQIVKLLFGRQKTTIEINHESTMTVGLNADGSANPQAMVNFRDNFYTMAFSSLEDEQYCLANPKNCSDLRLTSPERKDGIIMNNGHIYYSQYSLSASDPFHVGQDLLKIIRKFNPDLDRVAMRPLKLDLYAGYFGNAPYDFLTGEKHVPHRITYFVNYPKFGDPELIVLEVDRAPNGRTVHPRTEIYPILKNSPTKIEISKEESFGQNQGKREFKIEIECKNSGHKLWASDGKVFKPGK